MHVELTSRCVLQCPGCPRTYINDRLGKFPKIDLDLDVFADFINTPAGEKINRFTLEGNHGDPIYYPKLLEFIDKFRSNKIYTMVTNGSRRDEKFWHNLGARLTDKDWVIFSIDGLPENNHLYRKNSDWNSIEVGLKTLKRYSVNVGWKTIIFNYNHKQLDQIEMLANSYDAHFVSEKTSRFGDDALIPPKTLVDNSREYHGKDTHTINKITPQCKNHKKEYVSADGFYWPCCWIGSAFTLYKSELWKNRSQWHIKNKTIDQLRIQLAQWIDPMQSDPDVVCKMMCKSGNSEWPINHGLDDPVDQ
jgi:MoaA/NifB/PqqE/SkfB family radical SAM enzyme